LGKKQAAGVSLVPLKRPDEGRLQNELREGGKNKDPHQAAIPCTFVSAMSAVNGFALAKSIAERRSAGSDSGRTKKP
jgi:hypothetical protein